MDWNWVFLVNLVSAAGISNLYSAHDNVPWYLTAILILNVIFLAVSAVMNDLEMDKNKERIEKLEKELQELKKVSDETNV